MPKILEFFRRPTTLVTGTHDSDWFDVTEYKSLRIDVCAEAVIASGNVSAQLVGSGDMIHEQNIGSPITPAAGAAANDLAQEPPQFVLLRVTISGSQGSATMWAKGVARET